LPLLKRDKRTPLHKAMQGGIYSWFRRRPTKETRRVQQKYLPLFYWLLIIIIINYHHWSLWSS